MKGGNKLSLYTSPNWSSSALITIDTQNDFSLPGSISEIKGTLDILPNINRLLDAYRKKSLPIIHVIRLYKEDGSNADLCRKESLEKGLKIVIPGTYGAELVSLIKPENCTNNFNYTELLQGNFQQISNREWLMYKPRWGAFYETKLEYFLNEQNIDTLVFTGCNFPNCPRTSIYEASERDFKVVLASDAMSGTYPKGITELENIGVNILKVSEILGYI